MYFSVSVFRLISRRLRGCRARTWCVWARQKMQQGSRQPVRCGCIRICVRTRAAHTRGLVRQCHATGPEKECRWWCDSGPHEHEMDTVYLPSVYLESPRPKWVPHTREATCNASGF
ncbi:unnamed protein product [Ectocarpus sp. 12 AP-2014]